MTPEDRLLVLQWVRLHREHDGQDTYFVDADELETWLIMDGADPANPSKPGGPA